MRRLPRWVLGSLVNLKPCGKDDILSSGFQGKRIDAQVAKVGSG